MKRSRNKVGLVASRTEAARRKQRMAQYLEATQAEFVAAVERAGALGQVANGVLVGPVVSNQKLKKLFEEGRDYLRARFTAGKTQSRMFRNSR